MPFKNKEEYNEYMRNYLPKYRARMKEEFLLKWRKRMETLKQHSVETVPYQIENTLLKTLVKFMLSKKYRQMSTAEQDQVVKKVLDVIKQGTKDTKVGLAKLWDEESAKAEAELSKGFDEDYAKIMKEYIAEEEKKQLAKVKSLGASGESFVSLSEVEGMVREIVLKEAPHGKRSETETSDKPSEGLSKAGKLESAEEIFKKKMKKKQAL